MPIDAFPEFVTRAQMIAAHRDQDLRTDLTVIAVDRGENRLAIRSKPRRLPDAASERHSMLHRIEILARSTERVAQRIGNGWRTKPPDEILPNKRRNTQETEFPC